MNNVILVNGTFDIVHRGHIDLLNCARGFGQHLIVCIDSDRRVRELKGNSRPINNQEDRKHLLQNLKAVSAVYIFDSDKELEKLCKQYSPIMVKGSDYKDKPIVGSQYCKEIKFLDLVNGYSTTNTIQNIIDKCLCSDLGRNK